MREHDTGAGLVSGHLPVRRCERTCVRVNTTRDAPFKMSPRHFRSTLRPVAPPLRFMAPPVPLATGHAVLRLSARCTATAAHPSGLGVPPAPSALHTRTPAHRRAHAVAAHGRGAAAAAAASADDDGAVGGSASGVPAAPPLGDSFWRDGGGFPHYLQSKVTQQSTETSLRCCARVCLTLSDAVVCIASSR